MAERPATRSAREWRVFWEARGMRELATVVSAAWPPLAGGAGAEIRDTCLFRIASLLGSRAPAKALADELGRIRHELGDEPDALEDARAAHAVAAWFDEAARA
ncbi:MAG TPA: hypothetical protein VFK62_04080 [Gaiellaceae bacterium]|nr:hypothetical protein [Gaiellaceae bacterium]